MSERDEGNGFHRAMLLVTTDRGTYQVRCPKTFEQIVVLCVQ